MQDLLRCILSHWSFSWIRVCQRGTEDSDDLEPTEDHRQQHIVLNTWKQRNNVRTLEEKEKGSVFSLCVTPDNYTGGRKGKRPWLTRIFSVWATWEQDPSSGTGTGQDRSESPLLYSRWSSSFFFKLNLLSTQEMAPTNNKLTVLTNTSFLLGNEVCEFM